MIFVDTLRAFCWTLSRRFCAALLIECKRDLIRKAFKKFSRKLTAHRPRVYRIGIGIMRTTLRSALAIALTMLAISSPGHTACSPGNNGCVPSADEARAKIARLLDSALLTPHAIISIEKRDGREIEAQGHKKY